MTRTLVAALAVLTACASVSTTPATQAIAIVGVTVVDPSSPQATAPDQTILIADGVIRAVGPSSAIEILAQVRSAVAQVGGARVIAVFPTPK